MCFDLKEKRFFLGKVVWATATLPYVLLTILLIRGLMLPGAITGVSYYLQPELSRLADTQVLFDHNLNNIMQILRI